MSETSTPDLNSSIRRCGLVLLAVACTTAMMISTSYSHIGGWPVKVAAILAVAAVNAFLVAGFLMHLLSEKRMVYTVLLFTVCFFIGLMGLTVWAMQDFPPGTTH